EYRCAACGRSFERLVHGQQMVSCPACDSPNVTRLLSLFGFKSSQGFVTSSSGASGGGGGCGPGGGGRPPGPGAPTRRGGGPAGPFRVSGDRPQAPPAVVRQSEVAAT